jgi:hypothetical protein
LGTLKKISIELQIIDWNEIFKNIPDSNHIKNQIKQHIIDIQSGVNELKRML